MTALKNSPSLIRGAAVLAATTIGLTAGPVTLGKLPALTCGDCIVVHNHHPSWSS